METTGKSFNHVPWLQHRHLRNISYHSLVSVLEGGDFIHFEEGLALKVSFQPLSSIQIAEGGGKLRSEIRMGGFFSALHQRYDSNAWDRLVHFCFLRWPNSNHISLVRFLTNEQNNSLAVSGTKLPRPALANPVNKNCVRYKSSLLFSSR